MWILCYTILILIPADTVCPEQRAPLPIDRQHGQESPQQVEAQDAGSEADTLCSQGADQAEGDCGQGSQAASDGRGYEGAGYR